MRIQLRNLALGRAHYAFFVHYSFLSHGLSFLADGLMGDGQEFGTWLSFWTMHVYFCLEGGLNLNILVVVILGFFLSNTLFRLYRS